MQKQPVVQPNVLGKKSLAVSIVIVLELMMSLGAIICEAAATKRQRTLYNGEWSGLRNGPTIPEQEVLTKYDMRTQVLGIRSVPQGALKP